MKTAVCIFEDEKYVNFLPLSYTRPVYDLHCGILTLREKIWHYFPSSKFILHSRNYLTSCLKERYPSVQVNNFSDDSILFINGRLIMDKKAANLIKEIDSNTIFVDENGAIVAAKIPSSTLGVNESDGLLVFNNLQDVSTITGKFNLANFTWDLVNKNGEEIKSDFDLLVKKIPSISGKKYKSVEFKNKKQIFIGKNAVIDPFVFLDASDGPIYIATNARIMSHSYIQGPAYIGENSIIKSHTSLYHNTSIGSVCKIGGEVENSIIQSYSNKQHEGFLGHAYLGSWVNIGASSNNSDLKNNYTSVSVMLNGKPIDTGSQFVGLLMGDHSKTAINTMFNTGSIVGVSCNIFGAGFPDRYIPSFTWGGSDFLRTYDIQKSLEVAKIVMQRRNVTLTKHEEELLKEIFKVTDEERSRKNKN